MPLRLPALPVKQKQYTPQIVTFGGVNYSQNHRDGELADCRNLSTREYPCLSQRQGRKEMGQYANASSVFAHGKLILVNGTRLLCDGEEVGQVSAGEKEFAVVNTKLVIWPDKKFLDLENMEYGDLDYAAASSLGTETTFKNNSVKIQAIYKTVTQDHFLVQGWVSESDGVRKEMGHGSLIWAYDSVSWDNGWKLGERRKRCIGSGTQYCSPEDTDGVLQIGDVVMLRDSDVSGSYRLCNFLYQNYGEYEEETESAYNTSGYYAVVTDIYRTYQHGEIGYIELEYAVTFQVKNARWPVEDLTTKFCVGDRVQVSGCEKLENNTEKDVFLEIRGVTGDTLTFDDETFVSGSETGQVKVQRVMPPLDHICALNNRLWGTEGGMRIWGSALGDPTNFYVYDGVSTDSYAVAVGSDGDFTGCIGYGSNVLFWKEDKLHKLFGTSPDNYQLYEYTVRGLMAGCHKSQVIINETLFFKSRDGVCTYTGSVPSPISGNFGLRRFQDAVAGTDGEKYYISMQDVDTDAWGMWVFDPLTGFWMQEDKKRVLDFTNLDGTLYMLMDGGQLLMAGQADSAEEIEWEATFCEMTEQYHERKCYSRLLLRVDMDPKSVCRGAVSMDGGPFREVGVLHGAKNKTGELLVQPTNCDRFRIRLSGRGRCRVKSLIREFTFGGES